MTAGKEGMTISSIINTANDMGLTGNTPWDMKDSKKSHISSVCCQNSIIVCPLFV
jgi:hypothetical protein